MVMKWLEEAQLKPRPVKCQFTRKKVEYFGHVLTPKGLKVNCRLVKGPQNVSEVRHFLGRCWHHTGYRRLVPHIAQPLCAMTCTFVWATEPQAAMEQLKEGLQYWHICPSVNHSH